MNFINMIVSCMIVSPFVKTWFVDNDIEVINWPGYFLDLNRVENS